jgi:hypothetical protein
MNGRLLCLALLLAALLVSPAQGHKPSDSYLTLRIVGNRIDGQWDIALRDLDYALDLDTDQDGDITWGEVKAKRAEIAAYALNRLRLGRTDSPCHTQLIDLLVDHHSDGAYTVLRFRAHCGSPAAVLAVGYRLLFDLDPQHRGLLRLEHEGATVAGIFSPEHSEQLFSLGTPSGWRQFVDYVGEGVRHIWGGFDHLLFLLSLLLPAVLVRTPVSKTAWLPVANISTAFVEVVKVVSAFTVAHSITLALAALRVVSLPSRWVESAIALSVVLAALNNIRPLVREKRWAIAFGFGLVHGFGFAAVLSDLGLPPGSLVLALLGFNVGVELGQLMIVSVFVPTAYLLRTTRLYRGLIVVTGSTGIAVIASLWLCQRAFDFRIIGG